MRNNYSVEDLKAFCCIVRVGQYRAAAEILCVTPSALTRRIANIEESIGGKVLTRTTRTVVLTPLGEALYERLLPLLTELDSSMVEAARMARGEQGGLVVSMVATVAYTLLPQVIEEFYKKYPNVYLSIRDGLATAAKNLVEQRVAEFGITTHMTLGPALKGEKLANYSYSLVVDPSDKRFARKSEICWNELQGVRTIGLNPLSSSRMQIDNVLIANRISLPWFIEVDQLSTLLCLVQEKKFSAVLPSVFDARKYGLLNIPLVSPIIEREVFLIKRADVILSPQGQFFSDLLRGIIKAQLPER